MRYIVGIDEVGRGPLAGPVSIGVVLASVSFDFGIFKGLTDSKKMTALARERVCADAREKQEEGVLMFGVFSTPSEKVDEWGIERSISSAIETGLKKLAPSPVDVKIYLDGRLKAPKEYEQEAIIRGDSLVPAISLASVVAKVERDTYMTEIMHPRYPEYQFDSHKGYGTAAHIAAIKKYGPSPIHRRSFLSNILPALREASTMRV